MAGQGKRAIAELETSIALSPSFARAYEGLGLALTWFGRAADGIPKLEMAMRLNPYGPILWALQTTLATCCFYLDDNDEAVEWARKAVTARPDLPRPQFIFVAALVGQGRIDEARLAVESARRRIPDLSLTMIGRLLPHYHPPYLERLYGALRKAGLSE